MNKFAIGALGALAAAAPASAPAQRIGQAIVAVVDIQRITNECTACQAASAQLRTQVQQYEQRVAALRQPLQTEGQSIQTAIRALNGRAPDAALQQRITAFQGRENTANQELAGRQQTLRSIQAHVNQQISVRLGPIVNQVMQTRGANVVVDRGATLAASPALDVTNDVLAALNQQLPSVSVTPLPQQQQQPTGR